MLHRFRHFGGWTLLLVLFLLWAPLPAHSGGTPEPKSTSSRQHKYPVPSQAKATPRETPKDKQATRTSVRTLPAAQVNNRDAPGISPPRVLDHVSAATPASTPRVESTTRSPVTTKKPESPSQPKPEGLQPPENVRIVLVMASSDQTFARPSLRVVWNASPSPGVEQYKITLRSEGTVLQETHVSSRRRSWDSSPMDLILPGPTVEVRALKAGVSSPPGRALEMPLHLTPAALARSSARAPAPMRYSPSDNRLEQNVTSPKTPHSPLSQEKGIQAPDFLQKLSPGLQPAPEPGATNPPASQPNGPATFPDGMRNENTQAMPSPVLSPANPPQGIGEPNDPFDSPGYLDPATTFHTRLPAGSIKALAIEPDGESVWVGTEGGGLARLTPKTGQSQWFSSADGLVGDAINALLITRAPTPPAESSHSIPTPIPSRIEGRQLIVATAQGLSRIALWDDTFPIESVSMNRLWFGSRLVQQVTANSLAEDGHGRILLGTYGSGLLMMSADLKPLQQLSSDDGLMNDTIRSILPDPQKQVIWLGSIDGLESVLADEAAPPFDVRVGPSPRKEELQSSVIALANSSKGTLLLSAERLYLFEPEVQKLHRLRTFNFNEAPVSDGMVVSEAGDVWIATNRGLRHYQLGPTPEDFRRIELIQAEGVLQPPSALRGPSTPSSPERAAARQPLIDLNVTPLISTLKRGPDGALWLGLSDSHGLLRYVPSTGQLQHFASSPLLLHSPVYSLARDAQQAIWVGSQGGAMRFDLGSMSWQEPPPSVIPSTAVPLTTTALGLDQRAPVKLLMADVQGDILIGQECGASNEQRRSCLVRYAIGQGPKYFFNFELPTPLPGTLRAALLFQNELFLASDEQGLQVFLPTIGRELHTYSYPVFQGPLAGRRISALAAENHTLWVGTDDGLVAFDLQKPASQEPKDGEEAAASPAPSRVVESLRNTTIESLLIDPTGTLWVGTDRGLWRRGPPKEKGTLKQVFSGSIDRPTLSLYMDTRQRLWIGTSQGLYRSSPMSDPLKALAEEPSKLLSDRRIQALLVDDDGTAWVGSEQGLQVVPPFRTQPREAPFQWWYYGLGGGIVVAISLMFWRFRPLPTQFLRALMDSPELLKRIRLSSLDAQIADIADTTQFATVLLKLELEQSQWARLRAIAALWPRELELLSRSQVDPLVQHLAIALRAEPLLPSTFQRQNTLESQDSILAPVMPVEDVRTPVPPVPTEPDIDHAEGYDVGAPGVEEWMGEATREQARDGEQRLTRTQDLRLGTETLLPLAPGAAPPSRAKAAPGSTPGSRGKNTTGSLKLAPLSLGGVGEAGPLLYVLHLPELPIRLVQREIPLLVVRQPLPDSNPTAPLQALLRELQLSNRYVLVLNLMPTGLLPQLNVTGTRFIPLNEEDVREMLFAKNMETAFVSHIIKHVKLTEVSPYSSKGEVSNPDMFMGRRFELDRIISSERANFSIVGARQIGKSSLMGALKRYYRDGGRREVFSLTLTLQEDSRAFYRRIAVLLKKDRVPKTSNEFAEMLESHHTSRQSPILFLIDEVDGLLARERQQGYPVLTAMRRLQQQDICWFILAGYWELVRLGNDYHSPLYNMSEVIELGPLKADDATDLIVRPMKRMGLKFESPAIVADIVHMTSGQPHLIQFICNQLLERMTGRKKPVFTASDWQDVRQSDELKTYVTRNFKSNAGLLDEVIVYSTAASFRFSHEQVEQVLKNLDLNLPLRVREESVRKLKLVGILKEVDGRFEYALPIFREVLLKENTAYFAAARARELLEGRET